MSIFQPANSTYWYYDLVGPNGRIKRTTGTKDKSQAQIFHDAERVRLWTVSKLGDGGAHTFREAAARWLSETEKKTADKDAYQLAWFNEHIGDDWLSTINIEVINKLRVLCAEDEAGNPRSKTTVNLYMACLRSVLRKAQLEWGWLTGTLPKVPMYGKGKKAKKKAKYYLTPAEFERLRAELPEHLGLAAEFAVETGLRMRSMLGLTWDRVDMKAKHAWVPSDADDGSGGQKGGNNFGFTLSPGALAVLKRCKKLYPNGDHVFQYADPTISPMTDEDITRACRDLKKAGGRVTILRLRAELKSRHGVRGNSDRVTAIWRRVCEVTTSRKGCVHGVVHVLPKPKARPDIQDRPYDDGNTAAFKKAVVRAGLNPRLVHWHTFRHTFASWAVQSGKVTLQELMVMGDWQDMDSVLVYAHLAPGNMAHAASSVSEFRLRGKAA